MVKNEELTEELRAFSRFYTNVIEVLNQDILNSPYSLTEARILYDISKCSRCTANCLSERLNVDRGYMSRILNNFEENGLITKQNSKDDGRMQFLSLTEKGKAEVLDLEGRTSNQLLKLTAHLSNKEKTELLKAVKIIQKSISIEESCIKVRSYEEKDIDYIVNRHTVLYTKEYGFNLGFTEYVKMYVEKFHADHDENMENIWIAEKLGKQVGVIAVVKHDEKTAQLRWFLIEPDLRGKGLGRKLMKTALGFCREKGYEHVFLLTVDVLETARRMYAKNGFILTETSENNEWADFVVKEERWDLDL